MIEHDVEQMIRRLSDDVVTELGFDPVDTDGPTGADPDRVDELIDGVRHTVALEADHDEDVLVAVRGRFERGVA